MTLHDANNIRKSTVQSGDKIWQYKILRLMMIMSSVSNFTSGLVLISPIEIVNYGFSVVLLNSKFVTLLFGYV